MRATYERIEIDNFVYVRTDDDGLKIHHIQVKYMAIVHDPYLPVRGDGEKEYSTPLN